LGKYNLSFELQAFYPQFRDAAELAVRFPQTSILLGNSGMPVDREPDAIASWREELRQLAACPNVYAKIGGFSMVDHHWTRDSIAPFVRDLIGTFGVDRCMFGSNFPVDGLYRDFAGMWRDYHAVVAELPEADRHKLFHDNAVRVYRLS
jgi:predicted TIM-barrel fold metal-dependent hydrolase